MTGLFDEPMCQAVHCERRATVEVSDAAHPEHPPALSCQGHVALHASGMERPRTQPMGDR